MGWTRFEQLDEWVGRLVHRERELGLAKHECRRTIQELSHSHVLIFPLTNIVMNHELTTRLLLVQSDPGRGLDLHADATHRVTHSLLRVVGHIIYTTLYEYIRIWIQNIFK